MKQRKKESLQCIKNTCINYYKTGLVTLVKYAKFFYIKFYYSLKVKYLFPKIMADFFEGTMNLYAVQFYFICTFADFV